MWRGHFNAARMADGGWPGGLANHKFRLNGDFGDVFASSFDQIDDGLCRDLPHLYEWLPDGGEAGVGVRGARDVVEADNRNVFRNTEAGFADRPDCADGRNVVVSKKRSERLFPGQESLGEGISNPRRRIEALQLNGQFGTNANAELLRHLTDRVPTHRGIRTFRAHPGGLRLGPLGFAREGSLLGCSFLRWGWAAGSACPVGRLRDV